MDDDTLLMDALRDHFATVQYRYADTHSWYVALYPHRMASEPAVFAYGDSLDDAIRSALHNLEDLDD